MYNNIKIFFTVRPIFRVYSTDIGVVVKLHRLMVEAMVGAAKNAARGWVSGADAPPNTYLSGTVEGGAVSQLSNSFRGG